MTKKDYIKIAAVLEGGHTMQSVGEEKYDKRMLVAAFAGMLAQDNPRFDRVRFLAACGVTP